MQMCVRSCNFQVCMHATQDTGSLCKSIPSRGGDAQDGPNVAPPVLLQCVRSSFQKIVNTILTIQYYIYLYSASEVPLVSFQYFCRHLISILPQPRSREKFTYHHTGCIRLFLWLCLVPGFGSGQIINALM